MEAQYATNTILRGKFRGINTCIKKNKNIKYTAQLYISRNQKKKKCTIPKFSRCEKKRKKNKALNQSFEKIDKVGKLLARLKK